MFRTSMFKGSYEGISLYWNSLGRYRLNVKFLRKFPFGVKKIIFRIFIKNP